jgi:hypothetical protein
VPPLLELVPPPVELELALTLVELVVVVLELLEPLEAALTVTPLWPAKPPLPVVAIPVPAVTTVPLQPTKPTTVTNPAITQAYAVTRIATSSSRGMVRQGRATWQVLCSAAAQPRRSVLRPAADQVTEKPPVEDCTPRK